MVGGGGWEGKDRNYKRLGGGGGGVFLVRHKIQKVGGRVVGGGVLNKTEIAKGWGDGGGGGGGGWGGS